MIIDKISKENTFLTNFKSTELEDLKTIMRDNNHDKIDVLKMDIEGSEFDLRVR